MNNSPLPELPEPVLFPSTPVPNGHPEQPIPSVPPTAISVPWIPIPVFYWLRHGCYFAQWILPYPYSQILRFNGVMRIERHGEGVTASGDFYSHLVYAQTGGGFGINPDPSPSAGIPIFPRKNYLFYLRVTQVLEFLTTANTFVLGFERHAFNKDTNTWVNNGAFTAQMTFKSAPASYPSGAVYLEGEIKNSSGSVVGTLRMGWVSKYLRKATLEVDRLPVSEYPADNGDDVDWKQMYDSVDWDVNVHESDTDLTEISGASWPRAELHAAMLDWRDSADLDQEWRYYLICVRLIDGGILGVMYDNGSNDSNNTPREGAALSSHVVLPDTPQWGTVAGQRYGASPAPYFRTAVHEIGHAMGLQHTFVDNGIMNQTGNIASSPGTFPANILWSFSAIDERRLRHLPDPWVRPGMIPFNLDYSLVPISPVDRIDLSESLTFDVKPLLSTVPLGAPVRVRVTLRNTTDASLEAPGSLSLKSGQVSGRVVGASGSSRGFKSVMKCVNEQEHQTLVPGAEISDDLTLLRGGDGALFEASGLHRIKVDVMWEVDNVPFCVHGSAAVMVQPASTDSHAEAALKVLTTPDLLLALAIGGDHLTAGVEALQAALADETLAPHYAVIEAKRLARRFRDRAADPSAALQLLSGDSVMSPSEVKRMVSLVGGVAKHAKSALEALKRSAAGDTEAEEMIEKLS